MMPTKLEILMDKLSAVEAELVEELQKQEEEFAYEIRKRRVYFEETTVILHKTFVKKLINYLRDAPLSTIISTPIIWLCLFPFLALDLSVSLYQFICFPLYGIPKVKRSDYLIFDRRFLSYLNLVEKLNCAY
jgi:hypothetical protein